jgi:hypothetical protein
LAALAAVWDDQAGSSVAAVRDHGRLADSSFGAGQLPCLAVSVFRVATGRVTGASRNARGSCAVERGVRRLNSSAQEPRWFPVLPYSTCLTPWSSG